MWGSSDPDPLHLVAQSSPSTSALSETHSDQLGIQSQGEIHLLLKSFALLSVYENIHIRKLSYGVNRIRFWVVVMFFCVGK